MESTTVETSCMQLRVLSANHIPVPTTALVRDWRDVERAIRQVGGVPCVIKVPEGTQGSGVFLAHTEREASEIAWKVLETSNRVLVQEYIKESHGRDIRVLVVGGKVVAAMRRRAHGREFRSNFHLGGSVEKSTCLQTMLESHARLLDYWV